MHKNQYKSFQPSDPAVDLDGDWPEASPPVESAQVSDGGNLTSNGSRPVAVASEDSNAGQHRSDKESTDSSVDSDNVGYNLRPRNLVYYGS